MEAETYANVSRSNVGNHFRNEEWIEFWTCFFMQSIITNFFFKSLYTANTYSVDYTDAILVYFVQIDATIFYTLNGTNEC